MRFRGALWVSCLALVLGGFGCSPKPTPVPLGLEPLKVAGKEILVEVADTPTKRETGLMYRKELPKDRGMIFVFRNSGDRSFYMKNCLMQIDIAFIDAQGEIVTLHTMEPEEDKADILYKRYKSTRPVPYALEMAGGWFQANGIKLGDKVEGLPSTSRAR